MRSKKGIEWKFIHKWIGVLTAVFLLVFCISGLILNHRSLFSSYSVSRNLLPNDYHIHDFNNGIIKGSLRLNGDSILAFGNCGIWLTDKTLSKIENFNTGLPKGVDNRSIRNVVLTKDSTLWCATQYSVYRFDGVSWLKVALPECKERISDITLSGDSCSVVALSRSAIYTQNGKELSRIELNAPADYNYRISLFKTLWMLHSGELFGTVGRIIVDVVAIILIFLSLTGIKLFILPYSIRKSNSYRKNSLGKLFKWNYRWHDKIGYGTVTLTILIVFTGMCLRPPLMIPFVTTKTKLLPGSALDSHNAWQDKLRGIRWNERTGEWLVSTSEGFARVDKDFSLTPKMVKETTPPVSPMGITVFEPIYNGEWLIGSFSGMYKWNPMADRVVDYFSGKEYIPAEDMRPVSNHLVSGFSKDFNGSEVVFDYSRGCTTLGTMPDTLSRQPMSLWNLALELHVGRCYNPFLGPLSSLFIFVSGTLLLIVLASGLIIHNRRNHKFNNH